MGRQAFLWPHSTYRLLESKLSLLSDNKKKREKKMVLVVDIVLCSSVGNLNQHRTIQIVASLLCYHSHPELHMLSILFLAAVASPQVI